VREGDFLSKQGAVDLANRLKSFWAAKGYADVVVTIEESSIDRRHKSVWSVRSNLVDVLSREQQKGRPRCRGRQLFNLVE
jgi:hypothetical protein